jgi:hypothetical protein
MYQSMCSILEDDYQAPGLGDSNAASGEPHALLDHPLASQLFTAVEDWIRKELLGADAAEELAEVRAAAIRWIAQAR